MGLTQGFFFLALVGMTAGKPEVNWKLCQPIDRNEVKRGETYFRGYWPPGFSKACRPPQVGWQASGYLQYHDHCDAAGAYPASRSLPLHVLGSGS